MNISTTPTGVSTEQSVRLRAYLALESAMMALDDVGDQVAEDLRNALDPIWLSLTDDERDALSQRHLTTESD